MSGAPVEDSVLGGLSSEARALLLDATTPVDLPAGEWLFRTGDRSDALFVVQDGRVEVLDEAAGTVLRVLGPGAVLGEIGVLTALPRTASVRARRDTHLLRLAGETVEGLLVRSPAVALALIRAVALRLARPPGSRSAAPPPGCTVVALMPVTGSVELPVISQEIQRALQDLRPPARVALVLTDAPGADEPGSFPHLLARLERDHDVVVLVVDGLQQTVGTAWAEFSLRSADRVILVVGERDRPDACVPVVRWLRDRLPSRPDLCFLGSPAAGDVAAWSAVLPARAHHLIGPEGAAGIDRMVRRILGRAIGLVLSGGGARGFAHLGVVRALEEAGIAIDRVGGTSMGAIMGALVARGHADDVRVEMARRYFVVGRPLSDYTFPRNALLQGERMRSLMTDAFRGASIELLPRSFFCVSADLVTAEAVVHRRGPLAPALVASASIPGLLPPVVDAGRLLVDGGVLDNLPVGVMADQDEGPVVAVDVMRPFVASPTEARRRWSSVRRLRPAGRADPDGRALPPIAEALARATGLGSWRTAEENRHRAALTITVPDDGTGLLQWDRLDALVDSGHRAAEAILGDTGAVL